MTIILSDREYPSSFKKLAKAGIPLISDERAKHQDIRPLRIGLLNLMPTAVLEDTEEQFFFMIGGTPLQIIPELITFDKFVSSEKRKKHLDAFYKPYSEIKKEGLDGLIVTGANIEEYDYSQVYFWEELKDIIKWAHSHVASTVYSCWGMHAALNIFYDVERETYTNNKGKKRKLTGVFEHELKDHLVSPFTKGMNELVYCPHSRWSGIKKEDLQKNNIQILLGNNEVGVLLAIGREGREVYLQGHPEYSADSLKKEYLRDLQNITTNDDPQFPLHYFPNDNRECEPRNIWRSTGTILFNNWVNHVYQTTHYILGKGLMK